MIQTNTQQQCKHDLTITGLSHGEAWPPVVDLSRVSFAVQPFGIRTQEQLRDFVERNFGEIYRRTLPVVRNSDERAREIVQELYPRLVTMLAASSDGIREPWAVIRVVTRNLVVDGYRKTGNYYERIRRLRERKRPGRPENEADREEKDKALALMVDELLTTLEPRQHYIIAGIFLKGLLAKEIGEELGLSESRVADLKRDALERMRPHLERRIEKVCGECFRSQGNASGDARRSSRN
jgi:RNA polymerase sigma factor (sigma-70 family)